MIGAAAAADAGLAGPAARKSVELQAKLAGLQQEFRDWTAASAKGGPLRKHATQLQRLIQQLGGMADGVQAQLAAVPATPDGVLAQARIMQLRILEVHRLWDYFRGKLALRYVPWFADYLAAADDLAWECYAPVRLPSALPVDSAPRAAPLVFLTDEFSPYTHARADAYEVDDTDLPMLSDSQFAEIADALPVPVIGVPWYQVTHLPDLPLIAHEVGHDADVDLELVTARREHLAPLLDTLGNRRGGWLIWQDELFADLYGTLCLGPAFAAALMDLLTTDRSSVAAEAAAANPVAHPPAGVRMRAVVEMLRLMELTAEADQWWQQWVSAFPPDGADDYVDDVSKVVGRLDQFSIARLGGTLREKLAFSSSQQQSAVTEHRNLVKGIAPMTRNIRVLVAAARYAYDADPAGFDEERAGRKKSPRRAVLDRFVELRDDAPRGGSTGPVTTPAADRAAGQVLLDRIGAMITGNEPAADGNEPAADGNGGTA